MMWRYLNLNKGEALTCDKCNTIVEGGENWVFISEAVRDAFAFREINCYPCFLDQYVNYPEGETKDKMKALLDYLDMVK